MREIWRRPRSTAGWRGGGIGTSPIYTRQTVFNPNDPHPVPVSTDNVYGVVSLALWSVMIIVTVTYVLLAMRADNESEGGIMALTAASSESAPSPSSATTTATQRLGTVTDVQRVVAQQQLTGDLARDAAQELHNRLKEIAKQRAQGRTDDADHKIEDRR